MGPVFIALLFGIGAATWAYTKLSKANGNANPASNMVISVIAGFVLFLILYTLLKMVLNF